MVRQPVRTTPQVPDLLCVYVIISIPDCAFNPKTEWKFTAAQLIYNSTEGDWGSDSRETLAGLYGRFKAFVLELAIALKAVDVSMTMERSTKEDQHVHTHVYFHVPKAFHKEGPGLALLAPH